MQRCCRTHLRSRLDYVANKHGRHIFPRPHKVCRVVDGANHARKVVRDLGVVHKGGDDRKHLAEGHNYNHAWCRMKQVIGGLQSWLSRRHDMDD